MQRGFTLIELLVVIAIIAILSGIILSNIQNWHLLAENAAIQETMHEYTLVFSEYYHDHGEYPPTNAAALINNGDGTFTSYEYCLGDRTVGCNPVPASTPVNPSVDAAIQPYMPSSGLLALPDILTLSGSTPQGQPLYTCTQQDSAGTICTQATLSWVLNGTTYTCAQGADQVVYGGATYCTYTLSR